VTEFVEPGADSYEYGIVYVRAPNEPHRAGMTKSEADKWIAEWRQDGGRDIFRVIRRWLGPWELLGEITVDDRDIETIVFESLGEVSTCWDPSTGDAVFDSTRARAIGDRLLAEIRARIVGDRSDELREQRDTARSQRAALAQRCERLDERRHELHDLLTVVETERDRLRAVVVATATDARVLVKVLGQGSADAAAALAERIYDRHEPYDVGEQLDGSQIMGRQPAEEPDSG
jgi:hypothetical protein